MFPGNQAKQLRTSQVVNLCCFSQPVIKANVDVLASVYLLPGSYLKTASNNKPTN